MALNIDGKFEAKLTCAFKNDMRNLANLHQSTFESLKLRKTNTISGAHLRYSEGRGPNFRKGANQYKTKKKRI